MGVCTHHEHVGGKLKNTCVLIIGSGALSVVGALKKEVSLLIGTHGCIWGKRFVPADILLLWLEAEI